MEYWYNTAYHGSLGMTPFKAVYGRDPPTLAKYNRDALDPPDLQELLQQQDTIMAQLKLNLTRAQAYMKLQADKKRTHLEFNIGDMVLVKLQPYRQLSVSQKKNNKLGMLKSIHVETF